MTSPPLPQAVSPTPTASAAVASPAAEPGPDPCRLLTPSEVAAPLGETVTASGADLPAGLGGRQCVWAGADSRRVTLETRVDADLGPALVAAGESAVSVLDESVATSLSKLIRVPGLGIVAFAGDGHVYVTATSATVVLDDAAGLSDTAEVALARSAINRL